MRIVAIGTAFPENEYSQVELTDALMEYWKERYFNIERIKAFHENLLVGKRRFCITLEELKDLQGFKNRNSLYLKHAVDLGQTAIEHALAQCRLDADRINHLFFTSITGIAAPSIDARLVNRMALNRTIKRTPIFGLGCLGGAAGIARAADYVRAFPDQIAVLLSVELCSLTMQHDDWSIPNIVGSGLFGDGAAAVVIAGDEVNLEGLQVLGSHASFYSNSEEIMGWDMVNEGFKLVLSPRVPAMVEAHAQSDLQEVLDTFQLQKSDIKHFICHPGGPKVLEAIQTTLGIDREDLALSWETLIEVGNLSSTSVLLVLKETIERCSPKAGDYGLLMAMGPGFCSEWVVLKW